MDVDSIVDYIVEEVYKKIKESPKENKEKKIAVIIGDRGYKEYVDIFDNSYTVIKYEDSVKDCDIVFIPFLCIRGMGNLANGTISNSSEYFITKMLLMGKKVYVLESGLQYRKYKNNAPKALYNKFLEFENTIKNFGVEIIQSPIVLENKFVKEGINIPQNIDNTIKQKNSSEIRNKRLISESDIRKCYMSGATVIFVDNGSIITPLAKDFIKMNNLNIIMNNGG